MLFSVQDLEQSIESFGTVTDIKIVKLAEKSSASAKTGSEAYVRCVGVLDPST